MAKLGTPNASSGVRFPHDPPNNSCITKVIYRSGGIGIYDDIIMRGRSSGLPINTPRWWNGIHSGLRSQRR